MARLRLVLLSCLLLVAAALLSGALAVVTVSSSSMRPTVCEGDRLLVWTVRAGALAGRGDLVVLRATDGARLLKRLVAVGGQSVEVVDGRLVVDGRPQDERFVDLESVDGTSFGPVTVAPGSVFVLGDDREHSIDSRDFGDVPRSRVVGVLLPPVGGTCRSVP